MRPPSNVGAFSMRLQEVARVEVAPSQETYGSCWQFQVWDGANWFPVVDPASSLTFRLFPNPPTARLVPFEDSCFDDEKSGTFTFEISSELEQLMPEGDRWIRTCENSTINQCSRPLLLATG